MNTLKELKTRNDLADVLNIPRKKLSYILYIKRTDNLYSSFEIPKKNGGFREINAPLEDLKVIQKKLAYVLYKHEKQLLKDKNLNDNISHAFKKGKSFITNAEIHRNKRFVLNFDLENFFNSFHFGRVRGYFMKNRNLELPLEVANVIAQIACYNGTLPQGAPSSPIITDLICNILDMRLVKLAGKYRLDYTRYADDLTFSTNDSKFLDGKENFYNEMEAEISRAGFNINHAKTRIQYKDSRQEVTGIIVNKRLNVNRDYYKKTRAMAHHLYKTGEFFIEEGVNGTINQLEGRFSFINQLDRYNNTLISNSTKPSFFTLNGREKDYQQFIFYKYFFGNSQPLIVTEGKTDIVYIKAALKNLYKDYPKLITKDRNGQFKYKISFLKRSKRLSYFLSFKKDGADTMNNIYQFFSEKGGANYPNYIRTFKKLGGRAPSHPVILIFDNEIKSKDKPVAKFSKNKISKKQQEELESRSWINLLENLYLQVTPLATNNSESDIEMLFDDETLSKELDGKMFNKKDDFDTKLFYGKEIFSQYIMKNYQKIDFNGFRPLLDSLNDIVSHYKKAINKASE